MKNSTVIFHLNITQIFSLVILLIIWIQHSPALAQCKNPFIIQKDLINQKYDPPNLISDSNLIEILADQTFGTAQKFWRAQGNVIIHNQNNTIYTDQAYGDLLSNQITLPSTFYLANPQYIFKFAQGIYNQKNQNVETENGNIISQPFNYTQSNTGIVSSRGFSEKLSFIGKFTKFSKVNSNQNDFEDVEITTCPEAEPDWKISASSLSTFNDTNIGVARNIVLRFGGFPVFYLPWMDFPLDGSRKSGFLLPKIEFITTGERDSFNFTQPYYVNLAPNYDWLLSPTYLDSQGILLNNKFRYLTKSSSGEIFINGIDYDSNYQANYIDNNRRRYRLYASHQGQINKNLNYTLLGNKVSDIQYLNDYGDQIYKESAINLPNNIIFNGNYKNWQARLGYFDYQNLSTNPKSNKPYVRVPAFTFNSPSYKLIDPQNDWREIYGNTFVNVSGEWTNFNHSEKTNINRAWLYPKLSWQYNDISGFASWQIGGHLSHYRLFNPQNYRQSEITRFLPITKIGGGLIFERELNQKKKWIQTLEPSIYWLFIPYKRQQDIPVIDTSKPNFQLSRLNVDNLFSGWDRISDANVFSLGLTSRLFEDNGRELLSINLGQRYFLNNSKVGLTSEVEQQYKFSDFLFSVNSQLEKWRIESSWRYNPQTKKTSSFEGLLSFQPKDDRLIGIRYLYQQNENLPRLTNLQRNILSKVNLHEVIEGAIDWPLNDYLKTNISLTGRNYYSLADKKLIETRLGLRYFSCCMGFSIYRTNVLISENKYNQTWGLEFNLFGLGKWASKAARDLDLAVKPFRVR